MSTPTPHQPRSVQQQIGNTREAMRSEVVETGLAGALAHRPTPVWRIEDLPTSDVPPPPAAETPDLSALGPPIVDAVVDMELGQAMRDYVEANIPSRQWSTYGVAGLTFEEIWGEGDTVGLCEEPASLIEFNEGGVDWEASYSMGSYAHFLREPTISEMAMESVCENSIVESNGNLSRADGCDEYFVQSFFPEGSDCRACLEQNAGDWDGCVASSDCSNSMPLQSWVETGGQKEWFVTMDAYIWACAPDLNTHLYVLVKLKEDGSIPLAWDAARWGAFCTPYWDADAGEPGYSCSEGQGGWALGHSLGAGGVGRVNYIREAGSTGEPYRDRIWYSSSIQVERWATITSWWATNPGAGQISAPEAGPVDGSPGPSLQDEPFRAHTGATWGMNPYQLRPDGSDPSALNDTFARDWLATLTLKTATTRDGVFINTYNHNRCQNWEGPFENGSYRCTEVGAPFSGWHNDVAAGPAVYFGAPGSWDEEFVQMLYFPLATIGSTGLPDPDVPGGNTVLLAGTDAVADPDWDNCDWPHHFTPDVVQFSTSMDADPSNGALWGDTYKFGKDPNLDLRVVLNTNEARGYCATGQE